MPVKQVICIRRDLHMRRGKEISQGSHASNEILIQVGFYGLAPSKQLIEWLNTNKTKICVRVDSEKELMDIYHKAMSVDGLPCYLITDAGFTEFHGVPTKTCLAIGPHEAELIDPITKHLSAY